MTDWKKMIRKVKKDYETAFGKKEIYWFNLSEERYKQAVKQLGTDEYIGVRLITKPPSPAAYIVNIPGKPRKILAGSKVKD